MITPSTKFTPAPLLARQVAQAKIRRRRGVFLADPSRSPAGFSNPKPNPAGAARGRRWTSLRAHSSIWRELPRIVSKKSAVILPPDARERSEEVLTTLTND